MNNVHYVPYFPYDLRKGNVLQSRNPSSVRYVTDTISYIAPKIWPLVPKAIKSCDSLKSLEQKKKKVEA